MLVVIVFDKEALMFVNAGDYCGGWCCLMDNVGVYWCLVEHAGFA